MSSDKEQIGAMTDRERIEKELETEFSLVKELGKWYQDSAVFGKHEKFCKLVESLVDARVKLRTLEGQRDNRPKIICLCGSTRFIEIFAVKTWELEREGNIVLGCTLLPQWYCDVPSHFGEKTGTKEQCDQLHLRKIDLAEEVLVLNVDGYIGESTRNEIVYATAHGKPVNYLERAALAPQEAPPKTQTLPIPQEWRTAIARELAHMLQLHIEDTGECPDAETFEDMGFAAKDCATKRVAQEAPKEKKNG